MYGSSASYVYGNGLNLCVFVLLFAVLQFVIVGATIPVAVVIPAIFKNCLLFML